MYSRSTRLTILAGLAGSIAAHTALLGTVWSGGQAPLAAPLPAEPPPPDPIVPPRDDEIALGLDVPARSTVTWVGFATYKEHRARLSEIEQAAFTSEPSGLMEPPSAPALDAVEVAARPEPAAPAVARAAPAPGEAAPPQPQPAETEPQPAPAAAPQPTGVPADPGELAEQESDPTSDVPWDKIANGRPLAAQGLVLRPRKPVLTYWIRFSSAPADPVVTIRFGGDGVPVAASVDRSSGDSRVDEAILNSLYRWRAGGAKLDALAEGDTCKVTLRIVMSPRS